MRLVRLGLTLFSALFVISVLGLAFYYAVELAERLLVPWAPKFDAHHLTS